MLKKYVIKLTDDERSSLLEMVTKGEEKARAIRRAQTLLLSDEGRTDEAIAELVHVKPATVAKTRKRFCADGMASLYDKPRPGRRPILSGPQEARLIAEACSDAPEGRKRWTLRLLADRVVELGLAESYSHETVRAVLANRKPSRG